MRSRNILRLTFFRSAAGQDHQPVAVLAEIDAVPGPKSILPSKTPAPTPITFERLPSSMRVRAVVTRAALLSSALNQAANG
jgi:hypothetical protein